MIKLLTCAFLATVLAGCTTVKYPDSNPGILNEKLLGKATVNALTDAKMPLRKLKNKSIFIEVQASNPGRIYSHIVPLLLKNGVNVTNQTKLAKYTMRISEKNAGVNQVVKHDGWFALIASMSDRTISSQAKSELLIEIFKKGQKKAVYRKFSTAETLFEDIYREQILTILFFPIVLENYWAS